MLNRRHAGLPTHQPTLILLFSTGDMGDKGQKGSVGRHGKIGPIGSKGICDALLALSLPRLRGWLQTGQSRLAAVLLCALYVMLWSQGLHRAVVVRLTCWLCAHQGGARAPVLEGAQGTQEGDPGLVCLAGRSLPLP